MLSVVCFKWKPSGAYRSEFGAPQVNVLRAMVARHYPKPHRFICVTDDAHGIGDGIEIVPLWTDHAKLQSPHGAGNPSCYRRLRLFASDAASIVGERFVTLDLDCVITGDLSPLWDRPDAFVIWGDTALGTPYNGSMILQTAGARAKVWDEFDPVESPKRGTKLRYVGSDQAWIAACLGPHEKKWTKADGVYSYRNEIRPRGGVLPANARIVMFHGQHDPWDADIRARHGWVEKHWRL